MKLFPIHHLANKERSRSFESSFLHENEIRVPDWISFLLSPDLGRYYFTSGEIGAELDHLQVSRSLHWAKKYILGKLKLRS